MSSKTLRIFAALAATVILLGCGGGGSTGGSGGSSPATTTTTTTISGVVSKGPVNGATATLYAVENGAKGRMLGSMTTGADGSYSMNIGDYSGPVLCEATGGSYTDEATGQTVQMGGMMLRAATSNVSGSSSMAVTPYTEMAVKYMNGNYSSQMMSDANRQVGNTFGMNDIIRTMPRDVRTPAQQGDNSGTYYGLMLGAVSQMSKDTGKSISTIMQNFSNSMMTNNSAQLSADLSTMKNSYNTFRMGSRNMTGVTGLQPSGMMGGGGMM